MKRAGIYTITVFIIAILVVLMIGFFLPKFLNRPNLFIKEELEYHTPEEEKAFITELFTEDDVSELPVKEESIETGELTPEEVQAPNENGIDQMIAGAGDEILPEDVEDFRRIISKLDLEYINSIVDKELNEENMDKLRVYLHSRLNDEEYQRAKELFIAYSHLLLV